LYIETEFEPGDGTRYTVGIEPVERVSSRAMGWGERPCALFIFGPASRPETAVLPTDSYQFAVDTITRMQEGREYKDSYAGAAAAAVLAHLCGHEVHERDERAANVVARWDEQVPPRGPWREQLAAIRVAFYHETAPAQSGSAVEMASIESAQRNA